MNKIALNDTDVRRLMQRQFHALVRLAGDEPSVYEVGGLWAVCEAYRVQGRKVRFFADQKEGTPSRGWMSSYRMEAESSRYHVRISHVLSLRLSELNPSHVLLLGMCSEAEAQQADLRDEVMGRFYAYWDQHYRRIGRAVSTDPAVEFVVFRLQATLPAATRKKAKAEVAYA